MNTLFNFIFAESPSKQVRSEYYYFGFSWKDPNTGRKRHSKISTKCKTLSGAYTKRSELEEAIKNRIFGIQLNRSDKQTIRSLITKFLKEQDRLSRYTLRAYSSYLERFVPSKNGTKKLTAPSPYGIDENTPLCNVTPEVIRSFLTSIESESSRDHARRVLTVLFTYAVVNDYLDQNPMKKVKKRKVCETQRDWLEDSEFNLFWECMPETTFKDRTIKNAALLAMETGMRSGEIRHAQIRDAIPSTGILNIKHRNGFTTKGRRERIVGLSNRAILAINRQTKNRLQHPEATVRESTYLFPNCTGGPFDGSEFSRMFTRSRRVVLPEREGLHFHSLRHSNAQNAMNNGASLIEIANNLGHKGTAITGEYYAKISDFRGSSKLVNYRNSLPPLRELPDHTFLSGDLEEIQLTSCVLSE